MAAFSNAKSDLLAVALWAGQHCMAGFDACFTGVFYQPQSSTQASIAGPVHLEVAATVYPDIC